MEPNSERFKHSSRFTMISKLRVKVSVKIRRFVHFERRDFWWVRAGCCGPARWSTARGLKGVRVRLRIELKPVEWANVDSQRMRFLVVCES